MTDLWEHQRLAIEKAKELANLALFCAPGTGKTRTTIDILRFRYNAARRLMRTLVVGPIIVCEQWKREFAKFSEVDPQKIVVLTGPGERRLKLLAQMQERHPKGFIVVTNYEGLLIEKVYQELKAWEPEILVCDEVHRCKDPSTKRAKLLTPLADACKHRYILTGTPVLNSPLDLFQQYRLLDSGESFGKNFFAFRGQYFWDANGHMRGRTQKYFPNWIARADSTEKFQEILERTSIQARKEECIDLPEFVRTEIPVEMAPEQARAYEQMKEQFITIVREKAVTAQLAIVQTIRMQQILSGFVQPEDGERPIFFDKNPRLTALVDKVADLVPSGKCLIWTNFVVTYDMIQKALKKEGIESVFLTGRETQAEKRENVEAFTQGKVPVAICNAQAVGLGINLVEAKYSLYYSRTHSLEMDIQSEARNYRGGSVDLHEKVTRYDFFVPGTLDELILQCLRGKKSVADAILDWGRKT
jgi:SNF2 family DNA or RNA helicase